MGTRTTFGQLTDGVHSYIVQVVDLALNVSLPVEYTWTVDTVRPVTSIQSGPADPTSDTTATFAFSASDATPVTFACSLDGAPQEACASGVQYSSLDSGSHTFLVVATDAAGNIGDPANFTWTISQ